MKKLKGSNMENKILNLLNLQNELNDMTNGKEWKTGVTNKCKEINWYTAMLLEGGEAVDSTPWKHWKSIDATTDIENLQIEIVDIFHFLMSQLIVSKGIEESKNMILSNLEKSNSNEEFDFKKFNKSAKEFMFLVLQTDLYGVDNDAKIVWSFVDMMERSGLKFEKLYGLYIMKNALNMIRQKNGYKEGTYIKIWNGEEDNVVLHKFLEENPDMPFNEIIRRLQDIYNSLS